jgi:hypothetical protein
MANGAKKAAKNLRNKKENPDSWKEWTGARPEGVEGAGGLASKSESAERVAKARKAIKDNPAPKKLTDLHGPVSFINDRIGKSRKDKPKEQPKKPRSSNFEDQLSPGMKKQLEISRKPKGDTMESTPETRGDRGLGGPLGGPAKKGEGGFTPERPPADVNKDKKKYDPSGKTSPWGHAPGYDPADKNKKADPKSSKDQRQKPWSISGPISYDAPGTAKDRPEPARDKAHPEGEFTPEKPPADRNRKALKEALKKGGWARTTDDSSAEDKRLEAERDSAKADPKTPESTQKRIDQQASDRRNGDTPYPRGGTMEEIKEWNKGRTSKMPPGWTGPPQDSYPAPKPKSSKDSSAVGWESSANKMSYEEVVAAERAKRKAKDSDGSSESDIMSKFRKGTASNYDPNSSMDRAKMEALKAGKKDWATDKRKRKSPVKATGPKPTPEEAEKPKRRRKTRRRR